MSDAIFIAELTKAFGDQFALDHLSLRVEPGEIFGFLGPNGAGKSSTIRLLLDLIRPTSGYAEVFGFNCRRQSHEVRARTGYLPGDLRLYTGLTGRELAALFARIRGLGQNSEEVERVASKLSLDLDKHVGALSKGNRQKVGVLLALLGQPPLLLLDEPTSGLDPIVQHAVWDLLRGAAAAGTTVFLSSHVMGEVEQVCRRVGILRAGRLAAVEPIAALKGKQLRHVEISFGDVAPPERTFALPGVRELRRDNATVEVEVAGEIDVLIKAVAPYRILDLRTEQATLDEVLMSYYRHGAA